VLKPSNIFWMYRLTGFFLGGHDRDLYIKCTSAEYRYLPMVDVSQGGCIMTCSHFEKAAGRELSKKCARHSIWLPEFGRQSEGANSAMLKFEDRQQVATKLDHP